MEPPLQLIFIIIAILIVLTIWFLIIKFFLFPLFFQPKLRTNETFEFLDKENLKFIDKRTLNKKERKINPFEYKKGISFKKMYSVRAEYLLVGYSETQKEYKFFWVELNKWYLFHLKFLYEILTEEKVGKSRSLKFKEIDNPKIIAELKKNYETKTVLINDKCPACQKNIADKTSECPNCGLNLVA